MTNGHKWKGDKALTSTRANPLLFPPQFYTAFRSEISKAISHRERGVGTCRAAPPVFETFAFFQLPPSAKFCALGRKKTEKRIGEGPTE